MYMICLARLLPCLMLWEEWGVMGCPRGKQGPFMVPLTKVPHVIDMLVSRLFVLLVYYMPIACIYILNDTTVL